MSKYFVAIGTSHLAGDCSDYEKGYSELVYADFVSTKLNIPVHKFYLSGAENIELLQIVNEINHDYLTEDCVGVVCDVRIKGNNWIFPKSLYIDYKDYNNYQAGKFFKFSESVGLKTWHETTKHQIVKQFPLFNPRGTNPQVINRNVWDKFSASTATHQHISKQAQRRLDVEFSSTTKQQDERKVTRAENIIQEMIVAEQESVNFKTVFENYILICAIKNIIVNKGINFSWFDFNGKRFDFVDRYSDFDHTVYDYMLDINPGKDYDKKYYCECNHLNSTGHAQFGIVMTKLLKERWKL